MSNKMNQLAPALDTSQSKSQQADNEVQKPIKLKNKNRYHKVKLNIKKPYITKINVLVRNRE